MALKSLRFQNACKNLLGRLKNALFKGDTGKTTGGFVHCPKWNGEYNMASWFGLGSWFGVDNLDNWYAWDKLDRYYVK